MTSLQAIVELRRLLYHARCKKDGCDAAATVLARYVDERGRRLRRHEFCEHHALALGRTFVVVEMRGIGFGGAAKQSPANLLRYRRFRDRALQTASLYRTRR